MGISFVALHETTDSAAANKVLIRSRRAIHGGLDVA